MKRESVYCGEKVIEGECPARVIYLGPNLGGGTVEIAGEGNEAVAGAPKQKSEAKQGRCERCWGGSPSYGLKA